MDAALAQISTLGRLDCIAHIENKVLAKISVFQFQFSYETSFGSRDGTIQIFWLKKTVNGKNFNGLNQPVLLLLDHNEIKSIDGDSFKDLTKLIELDLHFNRISMIDPNLFDSLTSLEELWVGYNEIETIDEKFLII